MPPNINLFAKLDIFYERGGICYELRQNELMVKQQTILSFIDIAHFGKGK